MGSFLLCSVPCFVIFFLVLCFFSQRGELSAVQQRLEADLAAGTQLYLLYWKSANTDVLPSITQRTRPSATCTPRSSPRPTLASRSSSRIQSTPRTQHGRVTQVPPQFTCCTSTTVQILPRGFSPRRARSAVWARHAGALPHLLGLPVPQYKC